MRSLRQCSAILFFVGFFLIAAPAQPARADIVGGAADIVVGALSLPFEILKGTLTGPPVVGTLIGAVNGSIHTVGYATRGLFRIAQGAVPLVMKLLPFLPMMI